MRVDALNIGFLADEERNGLRVRGHVGDGTIAAHTAELQGSLFQPLISWSYRRDPYQHTGSHELSLVPCPQIWGQVLR